MSAAALIAALIATSPGAVEETWIGHQLVRGSREIPILGEVETTTESFFIASVERRDDAIFLRQDACRVEFSRVLGVSVSMPEQAVRSLPAAELRILEEPGGLWRAQPWALGWDDRDVEGDGEPGVTVQVDSVLCDGDVYVANQTSSAAEGRVTQEGFDAWVSVYVQIHVLGASTFCLRMGSSKSDEWQLGRVRYRKANPGTTCQSLANQAWPVRVEEAEEG